MYLFQYNKYYNRNIYRMLCRYTEKTSNLCVAFKKVEIREFSLKDCPWVFPGKRGIQTKGLVSLIFREIIRGLTKVKLKTHEWNRQMRWKKSSKHTLKGFICHGKKSELNSINYREPKKVFKCGKTWFT